MIENGAIVFVLPVPEAARVLAKSTLYSDSASLRLRAFPAISVLAHDHPVYVVPPYRLNDQMLQRAGKVVVSKFSTANINDDPALVEILLGWLGRAHGKVKLYADLCDNYASFGEIFKNPLFETYQHGLGKFCELTVSTDALREELLPIAQNGISVIEDPSESPELIAPRTGHKHLCWFGTVMLKSVSFMFSKLLQAVNEAEDLTIVTNHIREDMVTRLSSDLQLPMRFVEWSREACWQAIQDSDIVLLPQTGDRWGRVKSHNRLVETIRNGRWAIASPIPSYKELAEYCWIGDDFGAGVRWAREHQDEIPERIRAGQKYVSTRFDPDLIRGQWQGLLA